MRARIELNERIRTDLFSLVSLLFLLFILSFLHSVGNLRLPGTLPRNFDPSKSKMKALVTIFIVLMSMHLRGQSVVSGFVHDGNDTLTGANIFIENSYDGGTSNNQGRFSFQTDRSGELVLVVSLLGYEKVQRKIQLGNGKIELDIEMKKSTNEINTVEISAGSFETGDVKKMSVLNSIDIATTAGATADIYGALKTLPGVQPAAEESGLFVRGGDAHETNTYFDGQLVKNAFTSDLPDIALRGRFSPFMFKGTSFSTGAYSAEYGQALSGNMILESKDLPAKTKSDLGIMSVGLDGGHTQRFKNSSLEVNGAYYNLKPVFSVVKQNTDWIREPESASINTFYKLKTSEAGILKMYVNYEASAIALNTTNPENIFQLKDFYIKGKNLYTNASYKEYLNNNWKIDGGVSYGSDKNSINIENDNAQLHEKSFHSRVKLTRYFGKQSEIKAGLEYFDFTNSESYNELNHTLYNRQIASCLETNLYLSGRLLLRAGSRYEYSWLMDETSIAPRISISYRIFESSQISAGYGKFYQLPDDEYLFESSSIELEEASHYVLNYQFHKDERLFRVEAYYKDYDKLIKENSENQPGLDNSGYGYSKGIDVFFRDKNTIKRAEYWISYSFLDTERNYKNFPYSATPTFAAKNVLNLVGKYFVNSISTSIGASFTYASGRTYFNPSDPEFLSDRTRDYYNFSMNVSWLKDIAGKFTIIYLSVENIFGIKNVFGYRYSADGLSRKAIVPSAPRSIFIGAFITFGDNKFK